MADDATIRKQSKKQRRLIQLQSAHAAILAVKAEHRSVLASLSVNGCDGLETALDEIGGQIVELIGPQTIDDVRCLPVDLHPTGICYLIEKLEDKRNKGRTFEEAEAAGVGWCGDCYLYDLTNTDGLIEQAIGSPLVHTTEDLLNFVDLQSAETGVPA